MTSVNALVTLLEALIFLPTRTHTDTKALLYPSCTCARGVKTNLWAGHPWQSPANGKYSTQPFLVDHWHCTIWQSKLKLCSFPTQTANVWPVTLVLGLSCN